MRSIFSVLVMFASVTMGDSFPEPLTPERVLPAMYEALAGTGSEVEIVELSHFPVPAGRIEFPLRGLVKQTSASLSTRWRGIVHIDGDLSFSIWAIVRVKAPRRRIVALETLPVGKPIRAEQVREEVYLGFPQPSASEVALSDIVGQAPRRTLRAGVEVQREAVTQPIAVSSGDEVSVEVRTFKLHIQTTATALGTGRVGDTIPVRNSSSKKIFSAKVTGAGQVSVQEHP